MNMDAFATPHYPVQGPGQAQARSRGANIARVEAALLRGAHDLLDREGFTQVVAPTLTTLSGACGDPGTLLAVDLHGRKSYLSQTAQLHLEPLMRELGRVYSVSHSFRAERRPDERHLVEFTLIEAEMMGATLEGMMSIMESLAVSMLHRAAEHASDSLRALGVEPAKLRAIKAPFARMTYDDAIMALQKRGHFIEWGEDLKSEHELALAEMVGGPVFVTHYPLEIRFFTMKVCRHDPRVVQSCDLLMPGVGEVMGASETEADPDLLEEKFASSRGVKQITDLGGTTADYDWYLGMHREHSTQQAGFGMGFERLVRYACGLGSVGEAVVSYQ